MSSRDTKPKKKSRPKHVLEPISIDEILSGPGMSGFVSILEPREDVPHLQALVDDIQGHGSGGRASGPRLVGGMGRKVPEAEKAPDGVKAPEAQRGPGVERDTGYALPRTTPAVEAAAPPPKQVRPAVAQRHVRRAVLAPDGHSSGEGMVYQAPWNSKENRQETQETKLVTIGRRALTEKAR